MSPRKLAAGAFFIALGVLLPVAFHMVGLGKAFLPMHIPVLLAGFLCGPAIGSLTGILTPLLSAVLTGMPPLMPPTAQAMVFELAIYGLLAGLAFDRLKLGVYPAMFVAVLGGRLIYGLAGYLIMPLMGFPRIPVWGPLLWSFTQSLPGFILQLVVVPLVVALAQRDASFLFAAKRTS